MFITATVKLKRVIRTLMFPLQLLITASYLKNCVVVRLTVSRFERNDYDRNPTMFQTQLANVARIQCIIMLISMKVIFLALTTQTAVLTDVAELNSTFESTVALPSHFNQSYALQLNSTREKCDV